MLAIIFLIITTGGIAAYARARGGNPYLWGTVSVVGFVAFQLFGGFLLALFHIPLDADSGWILLGLSFAWVGIVAIFTRFLLGMGRAKPSGMWSCPNCRYLNQPYAVVCEACSAPYVEKV